jgi:hypothetical protein
LGIGFAIVYPTSDPSLLATFDVVRENIVYGNVNEWIILPRYATSVVCVQSFVNCSRSVAMGDGTSGLLNKSHLLVG